MKFKIEIACGNAAFEEENCGSEVARILRDVADRVQHDSSETMTDIVIPLYDVNGNKVGIARTEG